MKTLNSKLNQYSYYYNLCYNSTNNKLQIVKSKDDIFITDDDLTIDDNLICVFVINPALVGMLQTLTISFHKAKNLICKAVFKDIEQQKMYDKNSNLYKLLVYEFGLKNLQFS